MAKKQSDSATPPTRARKRRQGQHPTPDQKQQEQECFLDAFAKTGNVLLSCQTAGVDKSSIYRWAEQDETFALRKNQAERDFFWLAHAEFTRRALEGYEDVVTNNSGVIYWPDGTPVKKRVVSDRLLELIIKRGFPEYREKQQVEMTANVTTTSTQPEGLRLLTDEQLRMYKSWLLEAKARQEQER